MQNNINESIIPTIKVITSVTTVIIKILPFSLN